MADKSKKTNSQKKTQKSQSKPKEQRVPKPPIQSRKKTDAKQELNAQNQDKKAKHRNRTESSDDGFDGLFLIFIGVYILLVNLDYIDWLDIFKVLKFWPLIFIYWGLKLLINNKIVWRIIRLLISLLIIGLLIIQFSGTNLQNFFKNNFDITTPRLLRTGTSEQTTYRLQESFLEGVETRNIRIEAATGKVIIEDSLTAAGFEMTADYLQRLGEPQISEAVEDDQLEISVNTRANAAFWPRIQNSQIVSNYSFDYGVPDLPTNLNLNLEVGSAAINLDRVRHRVINLNNNLGSTEAVIGPEALPEELYLSAGMGSIQVVLPKEVNLIVDYDVGIGRLNVDEESLSGTGLYQTQSLEDQPDLLIEVEVGVGSILIVSK